MNSRINLAFYGFGTMVLLGDALVNLRFTGNLLDDIIGISLAVLLAALTAFFFKFIYKYNAGKAVFLPLLCLSGLFTVYSFSSYAAAVMLKTENVILPFLALTAISVYLAQSGKKAIYKLSFISVAVVGALIIVIALFSVQFMSAKYILPHRLPDFSFVSTFLHLYLSLVGAFLPIVVMSGKNKEITVSLVAFSLLFGFCFINVLGIFGSEFASTLVYPYSVAVSTAATGEIFSRLDGFFYVICFFTALIKTAAAVFSFKEVIGKLICPKKP